MTQGSGNVVVICILTELITARTCSCTIDTGACERWDSPDLRFSTLAPRCSNYAARMLAWARDRFFFVGSETAPARRAGAPARSRRARASGGIAQTYDFRPLRRVARTMPLACSRGRGTDFRPRRNRAGEARSCSCTVETGACERWDSADLRFSTLAPRCRSHARVGARRFSTEFSRGRVVDPRGTEENVQLCAPLPHVRDTGAIGRMHRKV